MERMGDIGGRVSRRCFFHHSSSSRSRLFRKASRKGRLSPGASSDRSHSVRIAVWSDPRDAPQSGTGGERAKSVSAASLCHVRSIVLGRSDSIPCLVISPGGVWRERVCPAVHRSNSGDRVEHVQSWGDQDREWRLKSPRRTVGTVGSRSKEISVVSDDGSSTSW